MASTTIFITTYHILINNFFWTLFREKYETESDTNPWKSTTIEWTDTTSPPLGHGNFETVPSVYRGPYEYSTPEGEEFVPQSREDSTSKGENK